MLTHGASAGGFVASTKLGKMEGLAMKLKQAINVIAETKYKIAASITKPDGSRDYEYLSLDYIGQSPFDFSKARARRDELCKMKNKVTFIHWNSAAQCIEIDVDVEG